MRMPESLTHHLDPYSMHSSNQMAYHLHPTILEDTKGVGLTNTAIPWRHRKTSRTQGKCLFRNHTVDPRRDSQYGSHNLHVQKGTGYHMPEQ